MWFYLAQTNELLGDQKIGQILDKFPMLYRFPDMGRNRDDLAIGVRSFPVKPYIIFYTHITDGIEIVRILHQSRDIASQFPEDKQ